MRLIYHTRKKVIGIEEKEIIPYETTDIKNLIYTIRGKQVMLDSDVAMLYHYKTKRINETVARNKDRFPENFCFQLTEEETENLRSHFATSSLEEKMWFQNENISVTTDRWSKNTITYEKNSYGGRRYLPYVFAEQGIAMLSGLLKNQIAIKVSINIMNAFVEMRKFISTNAKVFERLTNVEYKLLEHDKKFDEVFNELQKDEKTEFKQKIFFDGQIYDAYSLIIDIIKKAKEKILIIDNYIDDSILEMLTKKNKNVKVVILTSAKTNISKLDIQKFNKEYPRLNVALTDKFHDRFILIDSKELYHIGASLKDLGKKCFAISRIEEERYINDILKFNTN